MQPNPSPTLPISTQAASIGAMIVGALGAILTVLGVSLTTVSALQSIAQLLISAALIIAGLMAHTHLHSQQLTAQSANASVAPPPTTLPRPDASLRTSPYIDPSAAGMTPYVPHPPPTTSLSAPAMTTVAPGITIPTPPATDVVSAT